MKRSLITFVVGTSFALSTLFGASSAAMAAPTTHAVHGASTHMVKKHYVKKTVRAGSYCAHQYQGWYGYTSKHTLMKCKSTKYDDRLRWRSA